jgi:hypothetical protein
LIASIRATLGIPRSFSISCNACINSLDIVFPP